MIAGARHVAHVRAAQPGGTSGCVITSRRPARHCGVLRHPRRLAVAEKEARSSAKVKMIAARCYNRDRRSSRSITQIMHISRSSIDEKRLCVRFSATNRPQEIRPSLNNDASEHLLNRFIPRSVLLSQCGIFSLLYSAEFFVTPRRPRKFILCERRVYVIFVLRWFFFSCLDDSGVFTWRRLFSAISQLSYILIIIHIITSQINFNFVVK